MQSTLRDGPWLIGDLWSRQGPLVTHTLHSADLATLIDDLSSDRSLNDLVQEIPRQLCRRMRFRRGGVWLLRDGDLVLACSWPPESQPTRLCQCARRALRGAAALAPRPAPKSLWLPLRTWSGEGCGVVRQASPSSLRS